MRILRHPQCFLGKQLQYPVNFKEIGTLFGPIFMLIGAHMFNLGLHNGIDLVDEPLRLDYST
jgi:hypothetical protein